MLKPENKDQLAELLKDHVISGKVTLGKALDAGDVATLSAVDHPRLERLQRRLLVPEEFGLRPTHLTALLRVAVESLQH